MSKLTIALCGNPNSGKTTLFNRLTGANQKVGNWAGVTVERKEGTYVKKRDVAIVDTPGAYSLTPYSPDEEITANLVKGGNFDLVINVVDATNLTRNLFLTTQLLELDRPVVVALNLKDEAEALGIEISVKALETQLNCKVFYVSAARNEGIDELMSYCLSNTALNLNRPPLSPLKTPEERYEKINKAVNVARRVDADEKRNKRRNLTRAIDRYVLNKWLSFPLFFAVMAGIFYLSIGSVGKWATDLINLYVTPALKNGAANLLAGAPDWVVGLITEGAIGGVMSVASFVPQIMLLFGCIAVLEASGYMSRIAFITDRLLNKIGLGGRSFVSMILACGCSVPAIMSARTIKDVGERSTTVTLTPFVPCSAKLAVISFFTAKVLGGNALFALSFYVISIAAIILGGLAVKLWGKLFGRQNGASDAFVMELPNYRLPSAKNVFKQMWQRGRAFLVKAGTVIFVCSLLLYLAQNFDFSFRQASAEDSILSCIGKLIAPLFTPLGFDDGGYGWQFSVSALTGIVAKETVVTTLEILLPNGVDKCISPLGAYCFVVYNLLTAPCIAAISASFAEQGGFKKGVKTLCFQVAEAYLLTLAIYRIGRLFVLYPTASKTVAAVIAVLIAAAIATACCIKRKSRCANCNGCSACK